MNPTRMLAATAVMLAAALGASAPVRAEMAMTLPEVRQCLCQEQDIARRRLQVDDLQVQLANRNAELLTFSQEIMRARSAMNPDDQASVEYMRQLLIRQEQLRDVVRSEVGRPYQEALNALTRQINTYNQSCTTRPRIKATVDEARRTLQCPMP